MEENMQEKLEEIAMMIIANSGQARSDDLGRGKEFLHLSYERESLADVAGGEKRKFRRRRETSEGGRRESSNST